MSSVAVREATAEDWPAVTALLAELGRPAVDANDPVFREGFVAYIAREDAFALVAEMDGAIVGLCDLEFRSRLNYATPQAWIPDLIVLPDHRSGGVGAALLANAKERSRSRGCWSLTLESGNWRERAHAFYLREGLTDFAKAFSMSFEDGR